MRHTRSCLAVVAVLAVAGSASARPITFNTIALTGTDGPLGPGQGPGVTFQTIGQQQTTINSSGQVAFRANLSTAGTPQGVWVHSGSGNANVALAGGAQPGGGTYTAGASGIFNSTLINDAGNVAFRLGAGTGTFGDTGSGMARFALTGDVAPGTGGATFSSVASGMPLLSQSGIMATIASLTTGTGSPAVVVSGATANASGLWIGPPGGATLVARQNDTMLSLDPTGNTRLGAITTNNLTLSMNNNGHFVQVVALQGSNVVTGTGATGNSACVLTNRTGSLSALARVGNAAPDATGAASATDLFRSFGAGQIAMNNQGHVAFTASLRNAAGTQTSSGAFFTDQGTGVLHQYARIGDAMPAVYAHGDLAGATPLAEFAGVTWGSAWSNVAMNNNDLMVFNATGLGNTGGSTNTGAILTLDAAGKLRKVMRNGDVAIPHDPLNADFGLTDTKFSSATNIALNDLGQIAFQCTLTGNGVSPGLGNGSALFACDANGALNLIVRTGQSFLVAPGDTRIVSSIGGTLTSGGSDGHGISLNRYGILVFELDFTNGTSGVFTVTVPAPATAGALGLLGLGALGRRRRAHA